MKRKTTFILTLVTCALMTASCGYDEMGDIETEMFKVDKLAKDGGGDGIPSDKQKLPVFDFTVNDEDGTTDSSTDGSSEEPVDAQFGW